MIFQPPAKDRSRLLPKIVETLAGKRCRKPLAGRPPPLYISLNQGIAVDRRILGA
jgi:hypothetical protein